MRGKQGTYDTRETLERMGKKRRGDRSWGRRQRRETVVLIPLAAFGLWKGGGAFK